MDLAEQASPYLIWIALGLGGIFAIANLIGLVRGNVTVGRRYMRRDVSGTPARIIALLRLLSATPMALVGLVGLLNIMPVSNALVGYTLFGGVIAIGLIDFVGGIVARRTQG